MTAADALPTAAKRVHEAMRSARMAQALVKRADYPAAGDSARSAADAAAKALSLLRALGVVPPEFEQAPVDRLDLSALRSADSPKARALLSALEDAERVAGELDRERGDVDGDGEPDGWGETIAALRLRMELELFGPSERVTGGRE